MQRAQQGDCWTLKGCLHLQLVYWHRECTRTVQTWRATMAAYVVGIIDVNDPYAYELYEELTPPTVAKYGGRYIVQGGRSEVLEGSPGPRRVVLLEFESFEKAKEWWTSPESEAANSHRHRSATSTIVVV